MDEVGETGSIPLLLPEPQAVCVLLLRAELLLGCPVPARCLKSRVLLPSSRIRAISASSKLFCIAETLRGPFFGLNNGARGRAVRVGRATACADTASTGATVLAYWPGKTVASRLLFLTVAAGEPEKAARAGITALSLARANGCIPGEIADVSPASETRLADAAPADREVVLSAIAESDA